MTTVSLSPARFEEINKDRRDAALNALAACPATWARKDGEFVVNAPLAALEALTHIEVARRNGTSRRVKVGLPVEHIGTYTCGDCHLEHGFSYQSKNGTPR